MSAGVRAELLRLRTARSTWALLVVALALSAARMVLVVRGAGTIEGAAAGSDAQRDLLLGSAGLAAQLLPMVWGVLLVTAEISTGTLTATLLATPARQRVVVAKTLAAAAAGAVLAGVLWGLGLAAAALAGAAHVADPALLRPLAGALLVAAGSGVLGVGIGLVVRSPTVAPAVPVVWFVGVETLLTGFQLDVLRPWLPGGALAALSGVQFPGALPLAAATAVVAAYALALLLPGTRALVRRDVG